MSESNVDVDPLELRVRAVNRANKIANQWAIELADLFRPHVGQQVLRTDGELLEKFDSEIRRMERQLIVSDRIDRLKTRYFLVFQVKARERGAGPNGLITYAPAEFYVGRLDDGVLSSMMSDVPRRENYTVKGVCGARRRYFALKRKLDAAYEDLGPFGEREPA